MKIMVSCPSSLFSFLQEETETTLHVLNFKHQDMLNVFKKEKKSLKCALEQLDTEPSLLKLLANYARGKVQTSLK